MVADLGLGIPSPARPFTDDTHDWVDPRGRRLSDRIWGNSQRTRATIDQILRDGIRDGATVDEIANELTSWVRPGISGGKAHTYATFLAKNEMRRAHHLSTRDVATTDPAAGFLRYLLSRVRHIRPHDCDNHAAHDEGLGRGVWPAHRCPIPTVDTHAGCNCVTEVVRWEDTGTPAAQGMSDFVEQLRVEYDLADPPDMSPDELAIFRRDTAGVRESVTFMVRAWFQQTGLVTPGQLLEPSGSVAEWVASVAAEKRRLRMMRGGR